MNNHQLKPMEQSATTQRSPPILPLAELAPIVRMSMWKHLLARKGPASDTYIRRMGMVGGASCTTLEAFFVVDTVACNKFVDFVPQDTLSCDVETLYPNQCGYCGRRTMARTGSQLTCLRCGASHQSIVSAPGVQSTGPSLGGRDERRTGYLYKRTNHFANHLRRIQAKDCGAVRADVLRAVEAELLVERIQRGDPRITTAKVRGILKKLRLQKYYNVTYAITSRLSGRAAPCLTRLQEEKLTSMFSDIQEPFGRHCPPDRVNMISYSYVLHKMCQILGWTDLMVHFPLLKARSKTFQQDAIWKGICADLGWPFIKSIA